MEKVNLGFKQLGIFLRFCLLIALGAGCLKTFLVAKGIK